MEISVASVADAERAAALYRASFDDRLTTVAGWRYRMSKAAPEDRMVHWRAEEGGELVGWALGGRDAFAPSDTIGFAGIVVHPSHRRRGVGAALWNAVSGHLDETGVRRTVAHSRADADTVAFVQGRGFTLEATDTTSAVDPRACGEPPPPPDGVAIVSMSAFDDDPEPVYAADRESAVDEPGPADASGMSYENWRRLIWDAPDCDRELSVVAMVGSDVVATSFLYTDRATGRAMNAGTGVMRAFRGRGLGLLMKRHSLALAAAAGITRVITQNDDTNAPMLAINATLGYTPLSTGHAWVLER